ncbi:MAG: hypothetical protein IPK13_16030 [Deltaproteobacteria bacterium]|nr:hypothetical protein [Deltaproteobacteria bacterium]
MRRIMAYTSAVEHGTVDELKVSMTQAGRIARQNIGLESVPVRALY